VLIVCEGHTEDAYFKAWRASRRLHGERLIILNPGETDPASLVEHARRARKGREWDPSRDRAWVVMDGDEHQQRDRANWEKALREAEQHGVGLAVSNPCFELWYLLHFQMQAGELDRTRAKALLARRLPTWEPPACPVLDVVGHAAVASRRAAELLRGMEADGRPPYSNPCTYVGVLIEAIGAAFDPSEE
jgi:hypothetical protein